MEQSEALARRKVLYEELHPEAKAKVAGALASNRAQGNASDKLAAASFASDTAAKTGRSERTIQRDVKTVESLAPDVRENVVADRQRSHWGNPH